MSLDGFLFLWRKPHPTFGSGFGEGQSSSNSAPTGRLKSKLPYFMKYAPGEHYRKYGKKCYEKNKEKYKPVRKHYADTHRKEAVKRVQKYVQRHKEKVTAYNAAFGK